MGEIEIHPVRYVSSTDIYESAYPLLDFMGLITREVDADDKMETQTIKCTRNVAASIAMVCASSPYEEAKSILKQVGGLDLNIMTGFRVTDSVGTEFVKEVPEIPDDAKIEEIAAKVRGNVLESSFHRMNSSYTEFGEETIKIIEKAIKDGPEGILYRNYTGPFILVMYILCDGTGVPGRQLELLGIRGKQPDGSAKTFEAKIGAVFVVRYTPDGKPLVTENGDIWRGSVKYMGTVRKVEDFGPMLFQHAVDNGLFEMDAVVFLGDGAKWVWGIQKTFFPFALTAIDLYHAIEHVNSMIEFIQFKGKSGVNRKQTLQDECISLLRCGKIQDMLDLVDPLPCKKGCEKKLTGAVNYFTSNRDHMHYGVFTALGIFVGSGVIEAACKVIVGNRMKNSGMHWSKDHANKMIALRCAIKNDDFFDSYCNSNESSDKLIA